MHGRATRISATATSLVVLWEMTPITPLTLRMLHRRVRAGEHEGLVPVLMPDEIGRRVVHPVDLDDLGRPLGLTDDPPVEVQLVSDNCAHVCSSVCLLSACTFQRAGALGRRDAYRGLRVARRQWQPLLVVDGDEPTRLLAATCLRRQIDVTPDGEGLLSHGLLDGIGELAQELVTTYESIVSQMGDVDSRAQLPPGGGYVSGG